MPCSLLLNYWDVQSLVPYTLWGFYTRNLEDFFSRHAQWNAKNNLLCNYCSHTEMSQGSGWIKVEFQWYSALIPQLQMPSSWVSHFQINLSWLFYWQTQGGIWRGKPVTYIPRVKPPLLGCFQVIPDNSCRGWYI